MMKTRIAISVILTILLCLGVYLLIIKGNNQNKTKVGWFWYGNTNCDEQKNTSYFYYKNVIKIGNNYLIHIIAPRSSDEAIYQKGIAIIDNDSLKLNISEIDKFTFMDEVKRNNCLVPINFYFTTPLLPKTVTIQFDNFRIIPLDSIQISTNN